MFEVLPVPVGPLIKRWILYFTHKCRK